ncbi:MAG: phosphoribosylformylglycinamidine synthase [Oscillospiraceae bacterium]|nr:phosphoribosylformylglycinamidine synthase [Oscillospiraceae bacterium]
MKMFRCYTEKKASYAIEAMSVLAELRDFLGMHAIESLRILNRYDTEGISEKTYEKARTTVFSTPQTDMLYDETLPDFGSDAHMLVIEALPGQYDQRADSCAQCLELLATTSGCDSFLSRPTVITAKVYVIYGKLCADDISKIRTYLINPVESREAKLEKPETLAICYPEPSPVETIGGFIDADENGRKTLIDNFSLAMDMADLKMLQEYFRNTEKRNPTVTELRVLDTYWSDHCRHTTFFTHLTDIEISDPDVKTAYQLYLEARKETYGAHHDRPITLMDLATIAAKTLRSRGMLSNIEISDEVNACSIHIDATVDGKTEDWLLMFKNETHNHPTEVEPFGGASTCVGGAIRDPLSGRAYVYQAMRVTGCGDPTTPFDKTMPNKLPQRKLTITAAKGNCSYGNQIGLSAGHVHEIYHPGYTAKRMELGAVVGAVKAENVIRETPAPGDKIILLGGRTGRDGIGGATGSSKTQTIESLTTMSAEVQKGDAVEERKIQRLFLDPEVTKMIKKCNDFGAGGVSVAVGELADGLDINLSLVRTKYEGLDATEIAISESQERMAIVVAPENVNRLIEKAFEENLEAYVIAEVTDSNRMVMHYDGKVVVDISREFLSTNGAVKYATINVPKLPEPFPADAHNVNINPLQTHKALLSSLQYCAQRGLYEMFDGTIGANNVLMKLGGKTQSTPTQAMAALLPVKYDSNTSTCSVMAYGFDPILSEQNPFFGARTAVVSSVAKLVASGCDMEKAYLSFQEYFERLNDEPKRWGKPFSALLGAFEAQMGLGLAAIGGKDSMSGSFNELDVPPTLVSFAIAPNDAKFVITPEFKASGNDVVLFEAHSDLSKLKDTWKSFRELVEDGTIISAWAVTDCIADGIFKMTLGNEVGFEYNHNQTADKILSHAPAAIIAEVTRPVDVATKLGKTIASPVICFGGEAIKLEEFKSQWEKGLEDIFPTKPASEEHNKTIPQISYDKRPVIAGSNFAKPRTLIIAFPGTNGELDTAHAVTRAGGLAQTLIVRNMSPELIKSSITDVARAISESQIIIIPGGSSLGDEPDGSAKFINLFFRDSRLESALHEHLQTNDGLMLGICNGFQALIKLGLVPYGKIITQEAGNPGLSLNLIGRHQAKYAFTRVASVNAPWMSLCNVGDIHSIAISHGDGRFTASDDEISKLIENGQISTQYTDINGNPSMDTIINPNGSAMAVEGLFSPDGRVFGKMGHAERYGAFVAKNIYGNKHQPIFESGINYYK